MVDNQITLPDNLKCRSLHEKVIPTMCNLENMLEKLVEVDGDYDSLKNWVQRSYNAYQIDLIKDEILKASPEEWKDIIKEHILNQKPDDLGANCIDIYLVAYVVETHGGGRQNLIQYVKDNGISDKENSAKAIWQVGRGDGEYLGVLNDDGTVKDWDFFTQWIGEEGQDQNQNQEQAQSEETNDQELEALKERIDTMNNENKQGINDVKEEVHNLIEKVEQQNVNLQKQQEEIKELSEELKHMKQLKNNPSLWKKVRNYFTQNM